MAVNDRIGKDNVLWGENSITNEGGHYHDVDGFPKNKKENMIGSKLS